MSCAGISGVKAQLQVRWRSSVFYWASVRELRPQWLQERTTVFPDLQGSACRTWMGTTEEHHENLDQHDKNEPVGQLVWECLANLKHFWTKRNLKGTSRFVFNWKGWQKLWEKPWHASNTSRKEKQTTAISFLISTPAHHLLTVASLAPSMSI